MTFPCLTRGYSTSAPNGDGKWMWMTPRSARTEF
jgi:hypothetical protein